MWVQTRTQHVHIAWWARPWIMASSSGFGQLFVQILNCRVRCMRLLHAPNMVDGQGDTRRATQHCCHNNIGGPATLLTEWHTGSATLWSRGTEEGSRNTIVIKNRLRNSVIRVTEGPATLLSKEHIGPATQGSGEEMEPLQPCDQKNRWAPQHWKTVAMNDRWELENCSYEWLMNIGKL